MKNIFKLCFVLIVAFSSLSSNAESFYTLGTGYSSNSTDKFDQSWQDVELGYMYQTESSGLLILNYRTALATTHDNWSDSVGETYESDLSNNRITVAWASHNGFYLGYMQYKTQLADAYGESSGNELDLSVHALTTGLALRTTPFGNSTIRWLFGAGILLGEASLDRPYYCDANGFKNCNKTGVSNPSFSYDSSEYDMAIGYSLSTGLVGATGVLGISWGIKAEYQSVYILSLDDTLDELPTVKDNLFRAAFSLTY